MSRSLPDIGTVTTSQNRSTAFRSLLEDPREMFSSLRGLGVPGGVWIFLLASPRADETIETLHAVFVIVLGRLNHQWRAKK